MSEHKSILIVDDEPEMVRLLQMNLELLGYNIEIAVDGQEGLEMAQSLKPDLILLDVMMPKLNGYQVCRTLKGKEDTRGIRVVLLTAKGQESDKYWGMETGADDYVTKPFDFDFLAERIEYHLNG